MAVVQNYYELMAGLVDFLNNDTAMSERVSLSKNVKYGGLHGPTIRVRDGYSNELWNKVQVWKASMPEAEVRPFGWFIIISASTIAIFGRSS